MYLSVIIPAFNEEKTISNTLLDIDNYLSKQDFSSEIVVVSDGSKDKTAQIVNNLTKLIKNLRLIDNQENHGKGWVVRQGMLKAKGKYRLFMDADNATTVDHFDKIRPFLNKGYKIVIGSREKKDAQGAKQAVPQTFIKRQLGNMGNLLIQLLAVPGIWDTQCGFKVFRADVAENIFKRCKMDRWALDIEALALARKFKYKIGIIPVYWVNNPESRVGIKGYFITFRELFKIKWNLIRGKYD
ncbi:MAG: glycosyltransferase family 2 protein [Candidatus Portnoybacteria bacterium]|nr:glycosyltransferase family 2 protein [Candidatus Portnoybacteria bacterium]